MKTFKEIVYIAGSKYEITDENVFKHYRLAAELIKDKNQIVGFRNLHGFNTTKKNLRTS